jgi:CheY-like chemotaxis protein
MLTSLGYQVLTADDGVEAIEQVLAHDATIDAILMDQSMPRKDGLTATREIRELEANGTLSRRRPIVAVTAVVSSQAQTLCRLAGTDDFLAKPLSLGRLESCLREQLGGA